MDVSSTRGRVIPNPGQGLHVLLVDDDINCLTSMASVLQEQSYKVTTTRFAEIALSLMRERGCSIDLVIADVDVPVISGFTLLNQILLIKKDISVILMSSSGDADIAKKALDEGACFFFFKPVEAPDLIKVWQHVYRKRANRKGLSNDAEDREDGTAQTVLTERPSDTVNEESVAAQPLIRDLDEGRAPCSDDGQGSKRPKNVAGDAGQVNKDKLIIGGNDKRARDKDVGKRKKMEKGKKRKDTGESNKPETEKKPRMVWTPELQESFVKAVAALGEDNAHPNAILKEMDVPGLSTRHIASHLQKHRQQLKKVREIILRDPPILKSNMSRYPSLPTPSLSMVKTPSFFESNMTGYLTHQPPTMKEKNTASIFDTFLTANPPQRFQSPHTSSLAPPGFVHPNAYPNEGTAYNQPNTFKEFSQSNHVQYSADQGKEKQALCSFGGHNDNGVAPADNLGITNMDALIEVFTNKLADALGADANLHEDVKFLARYNKVVPQQSSHQEPSKEISTACEDLAPAETDFNIGEEQMPYSFEDLAMILKDSNVGSGDITEPSPGTDFNVGEQMTHSQEDLAMILDDSNVGGGDIIGSSSEPPNQPLPNVDDNDNGFTAWLNSLDISEMLEIFPDIQEGAL